MNSRNDYTYLDYNTISLKKSTLLFVLLASPHGSWEEHVKFVEDKSCFNVTADGNYKVIIDKEDVTIPFKAGECF